MIVAAKTSVFVAEIEAQSQELQAAYAFCRDVARREAKNFFYAFRVLPAQKSDATVRGLCRLCARPDDLADDESLSLEASPSQP